LKQILNCHSLPTIPLSDKKRSKDEPLSVLEKIRANVNTVCHAIKYHIRCSRGACETHSICLCIRANPKPTDSSRLDFLFRFKERGQEISLAEYIRVEPTKDSSLDIIEPAIIAKVAATTPSYSCSNISTSGGPVQALRGAERTIYDVQNFNADPSVAPAPSTN